MTVVNAYEIVQQAIPKGTFHEGSLETGQAPYPGQNVTKNSDGTYSAGAGSSDGAQAEVNLLREDVFNGSPSSVAYASGAHCFMYIPAIGDQVYVLCMNTTGTSQVYTAGETIMLDHTTGKGKPVTGSPAYVPYVCVQGTTDADSTADQLVLCRRIA